MKDNERENPIREFFALVVHESLCTRAGLQEDEEVEAYIAEMLIAFLHQDHIFAIRNANGEKVESIAEMLVEGDVRLNASGRGKSTSTSETFSYSGAASIPSSCESSSRQAAKTSSSTSTSRASTATTWSAPSTTTPIPPKHRSSAS